MKTLHEFYQAVERIRAAANCFVLRGAQSIDDNAAIVKFIDQKCDALMRDLTEAAKTAPPGDIEVHVEEASDDGGA